MAITTTDQGWAGREFEIEVGSIAHGGHCVARVEGRVVFVRHALPGERVLARVTEDGGGSFCRADAIEVLDASPDRVAARCPVSGPGGCGGCDFQHVSAQGQLRLKAAVIAEALQRIGGLDGPVTQPEVQRLDARDDGDALLGWRTRTVYALERGEIGLRAHRSHQLVPIDSCPISVPSVGSPDAVRRAVEVANAKAGGGASAVEVVEPNTVITHRPGRTSPRQGRGRRAPDILDVAAGPNRVQRTVLGRTFEVAATGFWQVHPGAAEAFVTAVLELADPQPGEVVLDLYAGAGLFTTFLADRVGVTGQVIGVESSRDAVSDAERNLADFPQAQVRHGSVNGALVRSFADAFSGTDVVVLDPPRSGAGIEVMDAVIDLAPRAVVYVACDPAAFARDVRAAVTRGWRLEVVRAFDAFPMTHHIECVGLLMPDSTAVR